MAAALYTRIAMRGLGVAGAALLASQGCHADPDALRQIVQDQCVPHWMAQHDPTPCAAVYLADAKRADSGYAVLADRKGGAHFLLIPTRKIPGIESPDLLLPDAPNYLGAAWAAREWLMRGRAIRRDAIGLAVNPVHARSQTQLHIHIECLRPDVDAVLRREADRLTDTWSTVHIGGIDFDALGVPGEELGERNPFLWLSERAAQEHRSMGAYTLIVAGAQPKRGPGFVVLASATAAGELLLDSTCEAAG